MESHDALIAQVAAAYLSNNPVQIADIGTVITTVRKNFMNGPIATPEADRPAPAVPIKKSITPDFIVCLEDGKRLKMLKRYLRSNYKLTPEQYRTRWGLPIDYPMVAPNYAALRSEFAKKIGLGKKAPSTSTVRGRK